MYIHCYSGRFIMTHSTSIPFSGWLHTLVTSWPTANVKSLDSKDLINVYTRPLFFTIKWNRCTNFANLFLAWNSTHFGRFVCPSSGVYSLHTQQWYMSYRFVDSFGAGPGWNWVPSWSCSKAVYKSVWHIPLLSVQWINSWWWTDEPSETCWF